MLCKPADAAPMWCAGLCSHDAFPTAWKAFLVSQQREQRLGYNAYQALMDTALQACSHCHPARL